MRTSVGHVSGLAFWRDLGVRPSLGVSGDHWPDGKHSGICSFSKSNLVAKRARCIGMRMFCTISNDVPGIRQFANISLLHSVAVVLGRDGMQRPMKKSRFSGTFKFCRAVCEVFCHAYVLQHFSRSSRNIEISNKSYFLFVCSCSGS